MKQTPEQDRYMFRPSMFFEGRYQVVDAKGTPIGSARDLSDAETITRYLNKAGREEVEPLEAENAKLRALVQVLVDGMAGHARSCVGTCSCGFYGRIASALIAAKEHGFVPTNTEDNG